MQTLRTRLTVAETKLLEREVEIRHFEEENKTLKEVVENIAEKSSVSSQLSGQHIQNGSKLLNNISSSVALAADAIFLICCKPKYIITSHVQE